MSDQEQIESRIVAAVGAAVTSLRDKRLAKILEAAEVKAIEDCLSEGISVHDSEMVIARKQAYRSRAKAEYSQG
jgi:hypothetical protein